MGGKETTMVSLYDCGIRVNKTERQKSNDEGNQPPQKRPRVFSEEKVTSCDDSDNSNEDDFSDLERY